MVGLIFFVILVRSWLKMLVNELFLKMSVASVVVVVVVEGQRNRRQQQQ